MNPLELGAVVPPEPNESISSLATFSGLGLEDGAEMDYVGIIDSVFSYSLTTFRSLQAEIVSIRKVHKA